MDLTLSPSEQGFRDEVANWLRAKNPDADKLRGRENALPSNYVLPQAWRTSLPEELYPTSYVVERTLAYLDDYSRRQEHAPFFLQCSFPDPHHPFTPPGRYWDLYKPQDMPLPESFRIGNRQLPPHAAALLAARDNGTRKGGEPDTFRVLHEVQGLEDLWQLHWAYNAPLENTPATFVARWRTCGRTRRRATRISPTTRRNGWRTLAW